MNQSTVTAESLLELLNDGQESFTDERLVYSSSSRTRSCPRSSGSNSPSRSGSALLSLNNSCLDRYMALTSPQLTAYPNVQSTATLSSAVANVDNSTSVSLTTNNSRT